MLDNLLREEYFDLDIEEEILNEIEREAIAQNPNGIHDDKYADWTIEKIKLLRTELERKKMIVENKKRYLDEWFEKEKKNIENKIAFYTSRLQEYFENLDPRLLHKTKTQLSYSLPSGKLKKILEKDEFERRDEELLDWLKKNNYTSFIKIKESVDWAKLKESIEISGDRAVLRDTGEIIEGIRIIKKPAEFKVE